MLGEAACSVCILSMLVQLNHALVCVAFPVVHHMVLGEADSEWNTHHAHVSLLICHFADKLSCLRCVSPCWSTV